MHPCNTVRGCKYSYCTVFRGKILATMHPLCITFNMLQNHQPQSHAHITNPSIRKAPHPLTNQTPPTDKPDMLTDRTRDRVGAARRGTLTNIHTHTPTPHTHTNYSKIMSLLIAHYLTQCYKVTNHTFPVRHQQFIL